MIKLRIIFILISCGIWSLSGTLSMGMESLEHFKMGRKAKALEDYKDFDSLFKDVIGYEVWAWNFKENKSYSEYKKISDLAKEGKIVPELISLAGGSLARFLQKDEKELEGHSPLEELYYQNLGDIAERICDHFSKTTELPPEIRLLRQIYHGETVKITKDAYPEAFLKVAYRVADQVNNYPMVEELYSLSGVLEIFEEFKKTSPAILSPELNYIHEPYWMYNIVELKGYGGRILEKLRPYFISQEQVINEKGTGTGTFILSHSEKILVRKVNFGYVLPNLYLKKRLENNVNFGVPRIFILPKDEKSHVTITFKMPYSRFGNTRLERGDSGNNPLQVLCDNFEIYQEYIEGSGTRGDRAFMPFGHVDLNAIQIIKGKDGKKYLVDTKEQKNFFMPYFSPFSDYYPDEHLDRILEAYGKKPNLEGKSKTEIFQAWQSNQQNIVLNAKSLNFDPRVMYVSVQVVLH